MSFYLDPSVLVSALVRDTGTDRVVAWFDQRRGEALITSDWTLPEVSSALALQVRRGTLKEAQRAFALDAFAKLRVDALATIPVSRTAFRTAANFVDCSEIALRATDALHLAVAAESRFTLCTRDRRQAEAGSALGVATELL